MSALKLLVCVLVVPAHGALGAAAAVAATARVFFPSPEGVEVKMKLVLNCLKHWESFGPRN